MAEPQAKSRRRRIRKPFDLSRRDWWNAIKRTVAEFREDNLTDWAAALTYYAVLSIFPAMIALVSILGLVGNERTAESLLDIVAAVGPESAVETFRGPVETVINNRGGAGLALVLSLAVALWTASGYVGAFGRAGNAIYEVEEGRPYYTRRPMQLLVTLGCILMLAVVLIALVVTGPLARAVGDAIGLEDATVTIWEIAKWPAVLVLVLVVLALLYYLMPNVRHAGIRWITPGSILAVIVAIAASALFALYVANFGSYNKTYGSLAGVIVFLLWLYIINAAVLLGAEMNAELERGRELAAGDKRAEKEIQVEPRAEPS
jgi:membrane protein